jgi:hypothetical protein
MHGKATDILDVKQNRKYGPRKKIWWSGEEVKKKRSTSIASKHLANKKVDVQHINSRMTTSSVFNGGELECYSQVA